MLYTRQEKPIYLGEAGKTSGGYLAANLVYCPDSDGLKWIGNCEKCELFSGHQRYKGVKCESSKPNNPPAYYNVVGSDEPIKRKRNGRRKKDDFAENNRAKD